MPKIVLFLLLSLVFLTAESQRLTIRGKVADSLSGKGLASATISLVKAGDSALVTFTIADTAGNFRMEAGGGSVYLLSVSYTGYVPVWKPLDDLPRSGVFEAGDIFLSQAGQLQAAVVKGRRPPVEINNDTIEFNAENFKTQPNAVLEDMLKKIPGVTVETDGTVKVNGQTVRRVLVNGKEFFTGDVKMATKNLNADAVDKLQVFDRKSDQAAFTGVDDGNSEKTINIQLKKDRSYATFGKVGAGVGGDWHGAGNEGFGAGGMGGGAGVGSEGFGAGAGNEGRYDGQVNINRFKGDEQLSFLGMANNTNRQGFSLMDVLNFTGELSWGMRNGGGGISIQTSDAGSNNGLPVTGLGQSQQGIATTMAGGLNYNNSWDKGRTSLNSNYTASKIRLEPDNESLVQTPATGGMPGSGGNEPGVAGNSYSTQDSAHTVHDIVQQRLGAILDRQLDPSFSFRLTPTLVWQHSNKEQQENYSSYAPDTALLNEGFSNTGTGPGAVNFTTDLLLRKKLPKKGRTLSADINITYNHSSESGNQLSDNSFYESGVIPTDSNINQLYHRDAVTRSLGGNFTYTEPLGLRSLLALNAFLNVNTGNTDKSTIGYNAASGKYDQPDSLLSNHFGSDYRYGGGGISFRSNLKKLSLTAGAVLQAATLHAMNLSGGSSVRQSFTDVLPNAILQYHITQTKNIRLEYGTYTTQPSVVQLQPVPDLSNPLDISTGNPVLKRTYNESLIFNYISANFAKRKSLLFLLGLSDAANAIVQSDSVTAYGTRMTMPVNSNGVGNLLSNLEYGWPVRKWHAQLEAGGFFIYSWNVGFVNGDKNNIRTVTFKPNISVTYNEGDKLDLELTAAVSLNTGWYSPEPDLNTDYMQQTYGVNMTNYLPAGLSLHNEFSYIFNTGRQPGYNTNMALWNLSVAKSLLRHDRGEVKLSVMDLLNQNSGITRSIGQGSIQDEKYNVLRRYFLLSFTYSLNKSGLKAKGGPQMRIRTIGQ